MLSKNSIHNTYSVHRLIAQHFIPNPDNLPCVLHKDETLINWRLDNWSDNLWWGTQKENVRDMFKKWRDKNHFKTNNPNPSKWKFWKYHHCSKKVNQYSLDWEFIKEWANARDIERELWVGFQNIYSCCKWKRKTTGWFIWKYV